LCDAFLSLILGNVRLHRFFVFSAPSHPPFLFPPPSEGFPLPKRSNCGLLKSHPHSTPKMDPPTPPFCTTRGRTRKPQVYLPLSFVAFRPQNVLAQGSFVCLSSVFAASCFGPLPVGGALYCFKRVEMRLCTFYPCFFTSFGLEVPPPPPVTFSLLRFLDCPPSLLVHDLFLTQQFKAFSWVLGRSIFSNYFPYGGFRRGQFQSPPQSKTFSFFATSLRGYFFQCVGAVAALFFIWYAVPLFFLVKLFTT